MLEKKESLSEQERVQIVSAMCSIYKLIASQYEDLLEEAEQMEVESIDIAMLTGIPLEIVNICLENLEDDGIITIDQIDTIDE